VAFGGKIHHRLGLVRLQQRLDEGSVFDASADEDMSRIRVDRDKIAEIACVGELIKVHNTVAGGDALQHEVRADETGAPGN